MAIRIIIPGGPRTTKNSSTLNLRGKHPIKLPSKAYRAWFRDAMWYAPILRLKLIATGAQLPLKGWLTIEAWFYLDAAYRSDLGGLFQGLTDWLQMPKGKRNGAGIIVDDYQFIEVKGLYRRLDREKPRIEAVIEQL